MFKATSLNIPRYLILVVLLGASFASSTSGATGLKHGVWGGVVLDSSPDRSGTNTSSTDYISDEYLFNTIDAEQTAQAMQDLSVDISVNTLSHRYISDSYGWDRVIDFTTARFLSSTSSTWPLYIAAVIEEPTSTDISNSWTDDYLGTAAAFRYEILDEIADAFTFDTVGDIVPDALILEEIDNWAALPDRPLSAFPQLIDPINVRDLIDAIQDPASADGLEREAWTYISAKAALFIGLESWVLGGDTSGGVDFGNGDYAGLEIPLVCRRGSDRPGGVSSTTPDDTVSSSDYFEVLMGLSPSFLHVDRTADADPLPSGGTDDEGLVLRSYIQTGATLIDTPMTDGFTYNTTATGLRFRSTPEEVELAKRGNIYTDPFELLCNGPRTSIPTPSYFRIQAECDALTGGGAPDTCEAFANQNYGYVADLKVDYHVLTNCDGEGPSSWYPPYTGGTNTYVVTSVPPDLSGIVLPAHFNGFTYVRMDRFFPWAGGGGTLPPGVYYYLKLPYTSDDDELEDLLGWLQGTPYLNNMPFCIDSTTQEADLDAAIPVKSQLAFLSESNDDYRYLDKPVGTDILLDGVIVRDAHGMTPDEYPFFDDEAQERLLLAISEAVDLAGGTTDLSYIETLSWVNEYDGDWVRDYLNNTLDYADGLVAGDFSMAWWETQLYSTEFGEFVKRDEVDFDDDLNGTTDDYGTSSYIDDDFDVRFFYPLDRKEDAVPGWYQKYSATGIMLNSSGQMTFEWDMGACSVCGNSDSIDMVIEFQATGTSSLNQRWIVNDDYSSSGEASDFISYLYRPTPEFNVSGPGIWNITVYMYSFSLPDSRRHGFFRLVDPNDDTTLKQSWIYESGIMRYSGSYPLSLDPSDHPAATNQNQNAGTQADEMLTCIGSFLTGSLYWESDCP